MNNTLESYRAFPYIAWALVIGFAFFTYSLTMQLRGELTAISSDVEELDARLSNIEAKNAQ